MGLIVVFLAMVGSWVPLFFIPFNTGAWFLMALASGLITAFLGWGLIGVQALSDGGGASYYLWWLFSIVLAAGGTSLAAYGFVMLIWRGAGLNIDVSVVQQ